MFPLAKLTGCFITFAKRKKEEKIHVLFHFNTKLEFQLQLEYYQSVATPKILVYLCNILKQ